MSIIQDASEEANAFSASGLSATEDEGENYVRTDTLGRTGSAIEVVVPIEFIKEIDSTESLPAEMVSVPYLAGVVLYVRRTGARMSMSSMSRA